VKINTDRFGEIAIEEKDLLNLPNGLLGFADSKRFVILDHSPESPFKWLQSVDEPALAFVVIDPLLLIDDYPMDKVRSLLEKEGFTPENIAVAVLATVPPAPQPITINLLAPIAFDSDKREGAQIILHDSQYTTRHILASDEDEDEEAAQDAK
jgi:flagellar assembly factor FliW